MIPALLLVAQFDSASLGECGGDHDVAVQIDPAIRTEGGCPHAKTADELHRHIKPHQRG
jgi:hypothetical protein